MGLLFTIAASAEAIHITTTILLCRAGFKLACHLSSNSHRLGAVARLGRMRLSVVPALADVAKGISTDGDAMPLPSKVVVDLLEDWFSSL